MKVPLGSPALRSAGSPQSGGIQHHDAGGGDRRRRPAAPRRVVELAHQQHACAGGIGRGVCVKWAWSGRKAGTRHQEPAEVREVGVERA
eukprot:gene11215-biopygen13695